MVKSDLTPYMQLKLQNGNYLRYINGYFISNSLELLEGDSYNDDLTYAYGDKEEDIIEVIGEDYKTLWLRDRNNNHKDIVKLLAEYFYNWAHDPYPCFGCARENITCEECKAEHLLKLFDVKVKGD